MTLHNFIGLFSSLSHFFSRDGHRFTHLYDYQLALQRFGKREGSSAYSLASFLDDVEVARDKICEGKTFGS